MRILHLIYDDIKNPWCGGGGAVRAYEINRRLARRHAITVITGNYPGARNGVFEGIKYLRVGSPRSSMCSRITYTLQARKAIKRLPHDILIDDFSANSPCLSLFATSKPVIASILNYFGKNSIHKRKILGLIPFLFECLGLRLFKNVIVETEQMKTKLKQLFLRRTAVVEVLPNGTNNELFELSLSEKNYILFIGRMEIYQKGIDVLLDAFSIVIDKHKNINLCFVGDTQHKDMTKIMTKIKELNLETKVQFLGRIMSGQMKNQLLSEVLFLCLPSRYDTMPLIAIEVAACGKPIIATRIPGLSEVIQDGKTGILVEPNNKEALSVAMSHLLENDSLRQTMGKNAREWARAFKWDSIACKQERFYYQVYHKTRYEKNE